MAIWVIKDNQREGPYDEQDVRELIFEGTYSDADLAIRDGQYHWSTLGEVLGKVRPAYENAISTMEQGMEPEMDRQMPPGPVDAQGNDMPVVYGSPVTAPSAPPALPVAEPEALTTTPVPQSATANGTTAGAAPRPPGPSSPPTVTPIAIVDFQMPFTSMVLFMVKWALAAIPAIMILGGIVGIFWIGFAMLLASLVHH